MIDFFILLFPLLILVCKVGMFFSLWSLLCAATKLCRILTMYIAANVNTSTQTPEETSRWRWRGFCRRN